MKVCRVSAYTLLLLLASGYAQSQTDFQQQFAMPKVVPASPDAAAIEKFGNFPVSYATGVPDISIPIWTIKCGPVSWPVTLSYHAGGIRVDESASIAGLGWAVNGIGSITRSRVGRPDEAVVNEPDYATIDQTDWTYLYSVLMGANDSELDVFNFNFNGRSGKFVITQNNTIVQIPQSNLKIVAGTGLSNFTITDDEGITYLFDQKELAVVNNGTEPPFNTYNTWFLRKVELPNKKDSIVFTFADAGSTSELYASFSQAVGEKYIEIETGVLLQDQNSGILQSNSGSTINLWKVTGINFPNGSLTFTYDAAFRQDLGYTGVNVSNKLTSIAVNGIVNNITSQLKNFTFYQSYFYNNPASAPSSPKQYRLRLDSLAETGMITEPTPKKYKFQYNTTPLVPRENFGQDIWGFNNGQHTNPSLLQSQSVTFNNGNKNLSYSIGNANRTVDTAKMKGWMLSSISYPTGGKTVFVFEPHVYNTDLALTNNVTYVANTSGDQGTQVATSTFTYPSTNVIPQSARLIVDMSQFNYPNVSQPSVVSLKNLTTGVTIYLMAHPTANQRYMIDQTINLAANNNYELKATTYSTVSNAQLTASIKVIWVVSTNQPDIRRGGGLRIKEMIHYTDNSMIATKDTYVYDTAVTLTPFNLIERTYSDTYYKYGKDAGGGLGCLFYFSPLCRVYNSGSVYAVSTALGSPMLYRRVEKISVNAATSTPNGKTVYLYDVTRDQAIPVGGQYALVPLITNEWKNGSLMTETHYKYNGSAYSIVKNTQNAYRIYNSENALSLRVQAKVIREGCTSLSQQTVWDDVLYYPHYTYTGSKRLEAQTVTDYDDNQNVLSIVTTNYYKSLKYDYATDMVTIDSKNQIDSVVVKRAPDFFVSGNVYDKMEQKNMLAPVIEQKSYSQGVLLNTVKNNYKDWNSDQKVLSPDLIQASLMSNPLETRLEYYGYDAFDNPTSVGKANDAVVAYLYAHNSKMPIAEATNTTISNIAYTSFETDEKGGWAGTFGAGVIISGSLTGRLAWKQSNFNFSKTGLSATTTYTVSYWSKNGAYSVNATAAVAGRIANGWTYYSHKVINPAGGTVTVTGSGSVDELRLYPAVNVQLTTYTYKPMVGVTSKCDANNRITYYEYDELQRLILVRDQDRNILKKVAYNYNGLTEYPNIYYNATYSIIRYKQGCTGCQIGSSVTYTVPADTYMSTKSLADATNMATADANANAQAYANSTGTCAAPGSASVPGDNNVSNGFSVKFHNNCTGTDYTFTLTVGANLTFSPAPPVGNYSVTITKMGGPGTYLYRVNGQLQSTSTNPLFPNVDVFATGNSGVIIDP